MDKQRRVVALGFFDGVHMGHGALLRTVAERAKALDASPCAFTFDRSPTAALTGRTIPLLTGVEDRGALMRELYAIEEVIVAPFDMMRQMDWRDFVEQYLQKELGAVHVVAGHDFRFGYKGEGDPRRLGEKCRELGMGCDVIPKVEIDGVTVSSTYIRALVEEGKMERAGWFLGHPHTLSGPVVHGSELGRTLGTPTANLLVPEGVIAPGFGVYAGRVRLPGGETRLAVTNVGTRPTVNNDRRAVTVEPWILDYQGDLYGRNIRVEFYARLRPEKRFPSVQALRDAILENARQTREYFAKGRG
ncbi:MAG: riboflavin biosynthesis protein RibF [Oscillospiraceae bacterium]|nr:riboflavin biosynthesis protein RibF [Oscillospiraceae bacterium]